MTQPTTATGKLIFLDQASNTGGFWAFMPDNTYLHYPRDTYILHDGDVLTVYDANHASTLWSGTISLQSVPAITKGVDGHWVRNTQLGVDLRTWATWFEREYPAQLSTTNQLVNWDYN